MASYWVSARVKVTKEASAVFYVSAGSLIEAIRKAQAGEYSYVDIDYDYDSDDQRKWIGLLNAGEVKDD